MVSSSQQANNPANSESSGFLGVTSDNNEDITAVYVAVMGGVLKQIDLADSFYTIINGKNLATKKSDIVTALEAIS